MRQITDGETFLKRLGFPSEPAGPGSRGRSRVLELLTKALLTDSARAGFPAASEGVEVAGVGGGPSLGAKAREAAQGVRQDDSATLGQLSQPAADPSAPVEFTAEPPSLDPPDSDKHFHLAFGSKGGKPLCGAAPSPHIHCPVGSTPWGGERYCDNCKRTVCPTCEDMAETYWRTGLIP